MKAIVGLLVAAVLVSGSGCATKQDWIDRTLMTVDVTGTWEGSVGGPGMGIASHVSFELAQQASTVTGSLKVRVTGEGDASGPIEGTVSGDVFRFKNARGSVEGEMTVREDEMSGLVTTSFGRRTISLRRVDPSSPPVPLR